MNLLLTLLTILLASVTGVLTVTDCACWILQYLLWFQGSACVKRNSTTANVKEQKAFHYFSHVL